MIAVAPPELIRDSQRGFFLSPAAAAAAIDDFKVSGHADIAEIDGRCHEEFGELDEISVIVTRQCESRGGCATMRGKGTLASEEFASRT